MGQGSIPLHGLVFGTHSLSWDALLSLDAAGKVFILPQLNVPGCYRKMSPGHDIDNAPMNFLQS